VSEIIRPLIPTKFVVVKYTLSARTEQNEVSEFGCRCSHDRV